MKIAQHERLLKYRKHLSKIKGKIDDKEDSENNHAEILKCRTPPPLKCLKSSSPTFTISTSTRFTNNIFEKFNNMSSYLRTRSRPTFTKSVIRSNKNLKSYSPIEKSVNLKKLIIKNDSRRQVTKSTKFSLLKTRKEYFQQKLEEKFKKYFFRQGKSEFSKISKSWISLFCAFGAYKVIKIALHNKIVRKKRAWALFKQFSILTIFIARILHRLNYIKRKLALRKIKPLVRTCKSWFLNRSTRHQQKLVAFTDILLNKTVSRKLIACFFSKIVFIQRTLKSAIRIRTNLIQTIISKWNQQEEKIFNNLILKDSIGKKKSKILQSFGGIREISLIPMTYKIKKIIKKIKEFVSGYINAMKNYKSEIQMKNSLLKMSWLKDNFDGFKRKKPVSPNILKEFTDDVIIDMITKSMKKRRNNISSRKSKIKDL